MGLARLEKLKEEFPLDITGMAFLLRPDLPPGGIIRPAEGGNELREPMRSTAMEAGLTRMRRPAKTPYSVPALEATEYAKEHGKFEAFHKLCYSALWDDGKDIGDFAVLEALAKACELDWAELEERLKSGHYREEVFQQFHYGRRIGFQGIPGFIIGKAGFTGAAPYPIFRVAAQRALAELRGETIDAEPAPEGEG
ncbi:MAG: DsbA family protein [Chloroflexi bacterium]|nr:DsbA family protein [Chloroflexota bacterium]